MIDTLTGALGLGAHDASFWIPLVLAGLFFLCLAAGVLFDGFDIGVGCLLPFAPMHLRARMLALLSPWRDANEFWLLLGLGILASGFPQGWSVIMAQLYLPLTLLGAGVLLRSGAFELRVRAPLGWQAPWAWAFACGSWLTALSHGLIVARVITAYDTGAGYQLLGAFLAVCALAVYGLLGATWLIMREPGELRARAVVWSRRTVRWTAAGMVAVSLVLALDNTGVFLKWGTLPDWQLAGGVWLALLLCFVALEMMLGRVLHQSLGAMALPFVLVITIVLVGVAGLAYSFFPYLVLDDVTVWDAASSVASLQVVLAAAVVVLPVAVIFNIRVYWGMFGASRPPQPPSFSG